MISSNYDQVAVNGVNSSSIQKVVSRKCKKYIQKYATDAAGCSDYFVLKLGIVAVTIENGGSQCPMPVEEYQPMYQRNQNLWPALAEMYGE